MASTIKIKRSSVAGKIPLIADFAVGEIAINTKDKKLYSSNGTAVFEIGSRLTNLSVSGNTTISGLIANGSPGTTNYVLKTNGTTTFWGLPIGAQGPAGPEADTFDFGTFNNTVTDPIMFFLNQLGMDLGTFASPAAFNLDLESF